jgi:sugar phosphate isomerase/epimerase
MQLSVFSTALQELDWAAMLRWLQAHDVHQLELGCGAYPGTRHADAHLLLADAQQRRALLADLAAHHIALAALSCHGNPLHPDPAVAQAHDRDLAATVELAHALHVPVVVCFSGQSGDRPDPDNAGAHFSTPNWPVVAWPDDFQTLRTWQWEERLIPYWKKMAHRAQQLGVQLALEMHGGFAVHNPATLLRLREACGPALGANLDPSHCWWQGMDPLVSVELLGAALFHVHLKDTVFNARALAENGVLDATAFSQPARRAWHFAMPGDGHGADFWRQLLQSLQRVDYRGVLSIEHEAPIAPLLGVPQTLRFMRELVA